MTETNAVCDEAFLRKYRELLDAEDTAFDELEHAYEDGDRAHFERDLSDWKAIVARKREFLDRHGIVLEPAST